MEIRDLKSLARFSPERMAKIPIFDSPHLLYDLYALLPGQAQKVHAHLGSDKVYYVLEGEVVVRVGEEEALLAPGMAALAPAGQPHGVRNESASPALLLVVMAPRP
ncbi:MAG: cupin domain-containing protein [Thermus sp.]|uniref:cupin domain-containing protein n=1 Tax=Thermus sp. TaxID=275 RepID=UPI0025FC2FF2|nr:cupin domain-containing protein [Thermus sp.]MCS6868310.1 cupin domain-containing protein [Thermus sp.]MCS7218190.1 cupin domain-containing protein [Thermus sp.]MCX7850045.1 cupin domain-containing protein [Thermus sp.]MDW8017096.1 cupin domain-containing protein [Thermus sp.]MDW8356366.1 cupin domain-containing protein [Thermus sp.]